ncbi:MAG TPA: hypothetical protein VFY92_04570 [Hyphomicrobiaceae bacterium]|nr:hypothetical protein [Hyphomicrobiaceae bacterium]
MASRIKHIVEPTLGWLFVIVIIVALGAVILSATQPTTEVTSRIERSRAH